MRVLFVMHSLDAYLRFFAAPLEELADRGHDVTLLLEDAGHTPSEQEWFDRFAARPNVRVDVEDHFRGGWWYWPGVNVRRALQYVRTRAPRYSANPIVRSRSADRAPGFIQRVPLLHVEPIRRAVWRFLSALDRSIPRPQTVDAYVRSVHPDVVAVCDYGRPGSLHSSYVDAARAAGIPSAICVASWDNLSTRQMLRAVPDLLLVWNEQQVEEAVELHAIPRERIVVTGAQNFDHWFDWPARPADEFKRQAGLDPERPYVLWVGGALYPSVMSEPELVEAWLRSEPARDFGVLVRPHPFRIDQWVAHDYSAFENVAVWPRDLSMPISDAQRADYFDSIFHSSAVVGVNTSAMIEAAIVDRPVLSILLPEFEDSQQGTIHFRYITEEAGGPVRLTRSFEELNATLAAPSTTGNRAFVERFVRPRGLDRAATPIFVDALEALDGMTPAPFAQPTYATPLRAAAAGAIAGWRVLYAVRRAVAKARGTVAE